MDVAIFTPAEASRLWMISERPDKPVGIMSADSKKFWKAHPPTSPATATTKICTINFVISSFLMSFFLIHTLVFIIRI